MIYTYIADFNIYRDYILLGRASLQEVNSEICLLACMVDCLVACLFALYIIPYMTNRGLHKCKPKLHLIPFKYQS